MQQPSTLFDGRPYLKVLDSPSAKTIQEINAINQQLQKTHEMRERSGSRSTRKRNLIPLQKTSTNGGKGTTKYSPSIMPNPINEMNQGRWTTSIDNLVSDQRRFTKKILSFCIDRTSFPKTTSFLAFQTIQKMQSGHAFQTNLQPFLTKEPFHPKLREGSPKRHQREKRANIKALLLKHSGEEDCLLSPLGTRSTYWKCKPSSLKLIKSQDLSPSSTLTFYTRFSPCIFTNQKLQDQPFHDKFLRFRNLS